MPTPITITIHSLYRARTGSAGVILRSGSHTRALDLACPDLDAESAALRGLQNALDCLRVQADIQVLCSSDRLRQTAELVGQHQPVEHQEQWWALLDQVEAAGHRMTFRTAPEAADMDQAARLAQSAWEGRYHQPPPAMTVIVSRNSSPRLQAFLQRVIEHALAEDRDILTLDRQQGGGAELLRLCAAYHVPCAIYGATSRPRNPHARQLTGREGCAHYIQTSGETLLQHMAQRSDKAYVIGIQHGDDKDLLETQAEALRQHGLRSMLLLFP